MSKIVDVKVVAVEVPLKTTWSTSLHTHSSRAHAVVEITTEDGIKGYGEASPGPAFMGESAYTIEGVVKRYLAPTIMGQSVMDIAKLIDLMDKVIDANTAAKSTVDIALHDAKGKALKVPVYTLLGGKTRDAIDMAWSIGLKDLDKSVEEAKERMKLGFKVMKVKVGKDINKDAELVRRVNKEFGGNVPIRMDANQGFSVTDAMRLMSMIKDCNIESFEQPCAKWDLVGMARLRKNPWSIPIMADESLSSVHDARNVLMADCADYYNIKVGKVGGLYRACQIAAMVEAAGCTAGAGSNLELGIGEAASAHFSIAQASVSVPSGVLAGTQLHSANLVQNPWHVENGQLTISDAPGLGIEVDPKLFS